MCGIFGVFNHKEASKLVHLGLHELQHRGQEAVGIASYYENKISLVKKLGLTSNIPNECLDLLKGRNAIGHVRYSTTGELGISNAQPIKVDSNNTCAVVHNGNLTNKVKLQRKIENSGKSLETTSDSEIFVHSLEDSTENNFLEQLIQTCKQARGSYSLILLANNEMYVARDPNGYRPLSIGKLGSSTLISSEPHAFRLLGGEFVRDVLPGEVIKISHNKVESKFILTDKPNRKFCIFEKIYFSRPDTKFDDEIVYSFRKKLGIELAKQSTTKADVVIPVPDSGIPAAIGFAQKSKLPYELGLIRNHYTGRTFIAPKQEIRDFGIKLKLHPLPEILNNKKVIVVDDSLVRGTTSKKIVQMLKEAGAKEVHLKISSPPIIGPCYFGINTPSYEELIACKHSEVEEIKKEIGADSLQYLSLEALYELADKNSHCFSCFTNKY